MSHIAPISMKASATIPAYRIVACSTGTGYTVKAAASAAERCIGVTADTVLDVSAGIPVVVGGIAKVYFNDTCTSGNLVASNNAGQGVPHVDTTAGSYVVGILIGPSVSATGTIADVLIQPHFKAIP